MFYSHPSHTYVQEGRAVCLFASHLSLSVAQTTELPPPAVARLCVARAGARVRRVGAELFSSLKFRFRAHVSYVHFSSRARRSPQ